MSKSFFHSLIFIFICCSLFPRLGYSQGIRTLHGTVPPVTDHVWTWEDEKKNHFRVGNAFFIFRKDSLIRFQMNSNQPPDKLHLIGRGYKSILVFLRASGGKGTVLFVPFGNKGVLLGEVNESGPLVFDAKEISLSGRAGYINWNTMLDEETNQGFLLNWSKGNSFGKNRPSENNNMEVYSLDLNKRKIRLEESINGEEFLNIWAIGDKGAAVSSRWDKKSYLYQISLKGKEIKKIKTAAYLSSLDRNVVTDSEIHGIPYSGDIMVLDLLTGEPKPPLPNPGKRGGNDLPYKLEHKQIPNDLYYDFNFKPNPGLGLKAGHWRSFGAGASIVNVRQGYLYICPSSSHKSPGVVVDLFQTPQMEEATRFCHMDSISGGTRQIHSQ